jgi:hypothetical protein
MKYIFLVHGGDGGLSVILVNTTKKQNLAIKI